MRGYKEREITWDRLKQNGVHQVQRFWSDNKNGDGSRGC